MRPTDTPTEQQPVWKHGTDLRDDALGIYRWPHAAFAEEQSQSVYPSVTTILDEFLGSGMRHAEAWFCAEYVHFLITQSKAKQKVEVWIDTDNVDGGETVEVNPLHILQNCLPESYGKNFGMHWIKKAGPREMRRRANRGSILHDALEEWAYGLRVDSDDVGDYCTTLLQTRDFRLERGYVEPYVRQLLLWCERHVKEVLMAEAMAMNDTYNYAGTLDTVLVVRGYPELDAIGPRGLVDAKGSKQDQPSHELQNAAYFFAEQIGVPNTAERVPMIECDWVANLYVQPDGCKLRHWPRVKRCDNPQDCEPFQYFLYARMLWHGMYSAEHPRTMKPMTVRAPEPGNMTIPNKLKQQVLGI